MPGPSDRCERPASNDVAMKFIVTPAIRGMMAAMSFLRHNILPLAAALLAALAVLFVSTASMACNAPADLGTASMSMSDDSVPCHPEADKPVCQKACLVFCQGLLPQANAQAPARVYASVRYPLLDARHADFTLEADDPPPRT